jgi:tetratricopeptide (TPR) repeat protein
MWETLTEFGRSLENKDVVTLLVSLAAFTISVLGFLQKRSEVKAATRKQLTDIIEKLHALNTEESKANHPALRTSYPENYYSILVDQRRFLVRQARFLADQIPELVSPYEFMVIGQVFDQIDDIYEAERFFALAFSAKGLRDFERIICLRQYARFLFRQGRTEEARSKYENAVAMSKGEGNRHSVYAGDTFERWARMEADFGDPEQVLSLIERALNEFRCLTSALARARHVERLEGFRGQFLDAHPKLATAHATDAKAIAKEVTERSRA